MFSEVHIAVSRSQRDSSHHYNTKYSGKKTAPCFFVVYLEFTLDFGLETAF